MLLLTQIVIASLIEVMSCYRFDFVVNITKSLNDIQDFHTFVVFSNDSVMSRGPSLEHWLQKELDTPLISCNGNVSKSIHLRNILNVRSLGFVIMNQLTDPIRSRADVTLTRLHDMKLIFILANRKTAVSTEDLVKFFWWCWNVNLLNVIVTFNSPNSTRNEVFTFTPFPNRIKPINLTDSRVEKYFWSKVADLEGYHFATPVLIDEPLVMKVYEEKTNQTHITGTAGRLYQEFVRHINATFFLINISNTSMHLHQKQIVQLTANKKIDISIHMFTYLLPYETDGSFPIAYTNACLIMPVVPEIDRSYYFIYTFDHRMWKLIVGLFITFLAIKLIANYTSERRFLVGHSVQSTIGGMINQPTLTPPTSTQAPPCPSDVRFAQWKSRTFLYSLLVFTGFFVTHLYESAMTSLFSTTVYGKQPESIEEILRTRLEILLLDYENEAFFGSKLLPEELQKRVRITDADTLANHRSKLDTSYAYIVKEERWKMIDYQQSRLWKPIFKIAQEFCIPNMFLSFPIQFDSPFYEVLKSFTLNVASAGLYLRWSEMSHREAIEVGVIELMKDTREHPVPLGMEHFKLVFKLITISYVMCLGCFLGEQYIKRLRRSVRAN